MKRPSRWRAGAVAVPITSAFVGAGASAAIVWAAVTPPATTATSAAANTVQTTSATTPKHTVYVRGDDGQVIRVLTNSGSSASQQQLPATHTTTGASGVVLP
jgi:hypothetical protein